MLSVGSGIEPQEFAVVLVVGEVVLSRSSRVELTHEIDDVAGAVDDVDRAWSGRAGGGVGARDAGSAGVDTVARAHDGVDRFGEPVRFDGDAVGLVYDQGWGFVFEYVAACFGEIRCHDCMEMGVYNRPTS